MSNYVLFDLINKWELAGAYQRLAKHYITDKDIKDVDENLVIHKLLGHENAVDNFLDRKATRGDRPRFFDLLDLILYLSPDSIKIPNSDGQYPYQICEGRLSSSASNISPEQVAILKRLKPPPGTEWPRTDEPRQTNIAVQLNAKCLYIDLEGRVHDKLDLFKQNNSKSSSEDQKAEARESKPSVKPEKVDDGKVKPFPLRELISCRCKVTCLCNIGFFQSNRVNAAKEMDKRLGDAICKTRDHLRFVKMIKSPTTDPATFHDALGRWFEYTSFVLVRCGCKVADCAGCNSEHEIFSNAAKKMNQDRIQKNVIALNNAIKMYEEFDGLPTVNDVRGMLADDYKNMKEQLKELKEQPIQVNSSLKRQVGKLKLKLQVASSDAEKSNKKASEFQKKAEAAQSESKEFEKNTTNLQKKLDDTKLEVAKFQKELDDTKLDVKKANETADKAKRDLDLMKKKYENSEKKLKASMQDHEAKLKESERKMKCIDQKLKVARKDVVSTKKQLKASTDERDAIQAKMDERLKTSTEERDAMKAKLDKLINEVTSMCVTHRSVEPSDLSRVLGKVLDPVARSDAQCKLLETVLTCNSEENKEALINDLPKFVLTLWRDMDLVVEAVTALTSYLETRVKYTQGSVREAKCLLDVELSSLSRKQLERHFADLKRVCSKLAEDCKKAEKGSASGRNEEPIIEIESSDEDDNANNINNTVNTRSTTKVSPSPSTRTTTTRKRGRGATVKKESENVFNTKSKRRNVGGHSKNQSVA